MKIVLALAVGASAFGGFGKSAAPAPSRGGQVAQGGQTVTNIQVPKIFTTAFGDPGRLQERAARAEAKKAEAEAQSAPVRRPSPRATCRVVATNHCFRTQAHPHAGALRFRVRPPGHPRRTPRRAPRKVAVERRVPRQGAPGPGQLRRGRRLRRRSHEVGAHPDRAGPRGLLDRRRQAPVQAPHGPDLDFARRQRFVPGNRHLNQKTRDDGTLIRDTTGAAGGAEAKLLRGRDRAGAARRPQAPQRARGAEAPRDGEQGTHHDYAQRRVVEPVWKSNLRRVRGRVVAEI